MLKNFKDQQETTNAMLSLLPTSGTLAGISIGLVGVVNLKHDGGTATAADDIFLLSALGFLLVCYFIFFALRSTDENTRRKWANLIDIVFLASLTLVVFSGFIVVYEFM